MLRQEDPYSTPDTLSAAQTRVTPEELAHAIATLEARKLDAERQHEGTIPIGEAVRELNLDATPEEVLAEVRAQRQAQAAPPPQSQAAPADTHVASPPPLAAVPPLHQTVAGALHQAAVAAAPGLKQAALAASPALRQGMQAISQHAKQPKRAKPDKHGWRKQSGLAFGIFFACLGLSQTGWLTGHHHHHSSVQTVPQERYLSTVPDGHEVYANTAVVQNIVSGADPHSILVEDGARLDNTWRLIRHDKHWYVRGFVRRDTDFSNDITKVYNDNDAGILHDQPEEDVTLRLDNSKMTDTNAGDDWSEIDLSQVHPDSYTHEDW